MATKKPRLQAEMTCPMQGTPWFFVGIEGNRAPYVPFKGLGCRA